jgi:hypothetical protein
MGGGGGSIESAAITVATVLTNRSLALGTKGGETTSGRNRPQERTASWELRGDCTGDAEA